MGEMTPEVALCIGAGMIFFYMYWCVTCKLVLSAVAQSVAPKLGVAGLLAKASQQTEPLSCVLEQKKTVLLISTC